MILTHVFFDRFFCGTHPNAVVSMAAIARLPLEIMAGDPWPAIVHAATAWAGKHDVVMRDAIVLLPFAQLLPLARREWARTGGWMPRIESTQTLARSLGPAHVFGEGQMSLDAALDLLTARRLLRSQSWARAWAQRSPGGFDHAGSAVVQTAHTIARAAFAVPPAHREAYWRAGRELLGAVSGPGGTERLLARVAFEWAAASAAPASDALFELQPSAWIVVQAGGPDALATSLQCCAQATTPCLLLDTDVAIDDAFAGVAVHTDLRLAVCPDFEGEAQRAAAQVLTHLAERTQPIALIAQDRLLVRRVRALLSRRQVPLLDETGWKLSTTRAGAAVVGLLRAARPRASTDEWLDWLKSSAPGWPVLPGAATAVQSLEGTLRRKGWVWPKTVDVAQLADSAASLWRAAVSVVEELNSTRECTLAAWLLALRRALDGCGAWARLNTDDAGRQVLAALHLRRPMQAVPPLTDADSMTFDEFADWVDDALEQASFLPASTADAPVVIMPLERAMLRPFAAVVFAGADEKRLGGAPSPHPLLSDVQATQLGLPGTAARLGGETLAFAQLLRLPRITLLRRLDDGGGPLAASPLLQRLGLAMARAGRDIAEAPDSTVTVQLTPTPVPRPLPAAPSSLLPTRLSASACEALRTCPYRFFALRLLALREAEELDDEVEKRDYGSWLHAVLHRFHAARVEASVAPTEEAHLHEIALAVQQEMHLDDAGFLPFAATFARFAPRYVEWLHARDRHDAQWLDGEVELTARPLQWAGTEMHGVIDRVDSVPGDEGPITQLIDYKTGSAQALRAMLKHPQEDTQLPFYAALMAQQSEAAGDIGAIYLPLDDADGIKAIEHRNVADSAQRLIDGIAHDLARLREGAAMPALGEGRACDHCEARGLCRRDHWSNEGGGG